MKRQSLIQLDYEIHAEETCLDAMSDRCADEHADGCECTQLKVRRLNRMRSQYRQATGSRWYKKTDLTFQGDESLNTRVDLWYIRNHPESQPFSWQVMPAGEVALS